MEKFKELKTLIASMEEDVTKFYNKGNSEAGVRVRKALQNVKILAQEIRIEISAIKNSNADKEKQN